MQVAHPQFRILFGFLCSGYDLSRFSRVVGLVSFVFHYWVDGSFVPAATCGFAFSFVGFALTAVGSTVLADNVMEYQSISSPNRTNAFYNMVLPSLFGEMDLQRTKLEQ